MPPSLQKECAAVSSNGRARASERRRRHRALAERGEGEVCGGARQPVGQDEIRKGGGAILWEEVGVGGLGGRLVARAPEPLKQIARDE